MLDNFIEDLKFGEKYEYELLKYLDYEKFEKSDGYFKEYDIKIFKNNKIKTYEVKADRFSHKTGNFCIEYKSNNKLSGISTTTAKYWAVFVIINSEKYELYIIPTKSIIKKINKKLYTRDVLIANKKNNCYLFNKNLFEKYKIL